MITKKQTLEKIESLKNELLFHEKRLKEFEELNIGDMARVIDCSFSCNLLKERAPNFFSKIVEVIESGDYPCFEYYNFKNIRNDTLIRYNGELYFIQKRFLEKVI